MTKPARTKVKAVADQSEQAFEQILKDGEPVGRLMLEGDEKGFIKFEGDAAEGSVDGE